MPTERSFLTKAKQEVKPILAYVVGALLTLTALVLTAAWVQPPFASKDNCWKHILFHFIVFMHLGCVLGASLVTMITWIIAAFLALSLVVSVLSILVSLVLSMLTS